MLSRYKSSIRLIAAIIIIAGLLVIIGWLTGNEHLKSVVPGLPTMKFNTAICFILAGTSLYLLSCYKKINQNLQLFTTSALFIIILLTLIEIYTNAAINIDEWFVIDVGDRLMDKPDPGRMATSTAFCMLLCCITFIFSASTKKYLKIAGQYALHLVTLISFIAILGYIYKIPQFYTLSFLSSMAISTAVLLFLLSLAASFINYSFGFTGLFTGKRMGSIMARSLFPVTVFVVVILGSIRLQLHWKNMVSVDFGIALFATSFILVSLLLIAYTAYYLNKVDHKRSQAEEMLKEMNISLEQKVQDRTHEIKKVKDNLVLATKTSGIGIWEWNATDGKFIWDEKMFSLYGIPVNHGLNLYKVWKSAIITEDVERLTKSVYKVVNNAVELNLEYGINWPDESVHYIQSNTITQRDEQGKAVRIIGTNVEITIQKEAYKKIQHSEEKFRNLLESAPDAVIIVNKKGIIELINRQTEKLFGYTRDEMIGMPVEMLLPAEIKNIHQQNRTDFFSNPKTRSMGSGLNLFAARKGGEKFPVEISLSPLETGDGLLVSAAIRDISENRNMLEALRKSEEQLKAIFTGAPDAIIVIDEEGLVFQWNQQATNIFGWTAEEVTGHSLSETIVPPKYRDAHKAGMSRFLKTGKSTILGTNIEIQAITKNNIEVDIALTISPIQMKGHQMFIGFIRDITQQKKKDEIILNNERKFRMALGIMGDNVWEHDFITDKTFFAETIHEFIGYTNQEISDEAAIWWRLVHPDDHWMLKQSDADYRAGISNSHHLEYRIHNKQGKLKWVLDRGVVVEKDKDGKPLKVIGTHTDITARKNAEASINKLKKQFQSFMEHIPAMAWIVDKKSVYQFTNDNYVTTFYNDLENGDHEQLVGKSFFELFPQEIAELYKTNNDFVFNSNKVLETIEPSVDRAGNKITLKVFKFPLQISNAETLLGGIAIDITELVKAEENMRLLNKKITASNNELEQFAYVASHDLQEPLRMVSSFMQLLEKKYSPQLDDTAKQYIHFAVDGAERMKKLILDLLSFSRIGTEQQFNDAVDLNEVLSEVKLNLMNAISESNATIEVEKLPLIKANKVQIVQLFQNLVNNAIKYRSEKNPVIKIGCIQESDYYRFFVKDNGIGIDSKYFEKIFIIFQRLHTRTEFSGTGIGLSICKKIAEKHRGHLTVESTLGEGSVFSFYYPKK